MQIKALTTLGLLGLGSLAVNAFPIAAPGTEGVPVVVASGNPVVATYEGNSASFSNDLYLERDAAGNPGLDGILANDLFVFNNHANSPGDTKALGSFSAGAELIFRLHVNNTRNDFFSGATPNPDGHFHARVQDNWLPSTTLVSFEDLFNGPFDYNDLSFSFSNTRGGGGGSVPDVMGTGALMSLVSTGLPFAAARRRR